MTFDDVPVAEAEGLILAHGVRLPGKVLKKGHIVSAEDIAALQKAGIATVSGARLEPSDMPEDEAALALAQAATGPGLSLGRAFTGRCNIFAEARGLAVIDAARIDRINLVDETLTIGTIPPFALVEPGQMIATIKVIPFAAPRQVVDACVAIAREGGPLLRIAELKGKHVGLIQTRLPGTKESVLDSTTGAIVTRISALDGELVAEMRCDHARDQVADAISRLLDRGCDAILIAGASAIVDRRDVIPAAITEAGGTIDHFGMPVDPGNLLLLAHRGTTPVLGLPGCARSLKLNGFDWVLQRLFADVPVTGRDIMLMGAGGLLMEMAGRPMPRADASPKPKKQTETAVTSAGPARIGAVILAAGQSRRMGRDVNKLLVEVEGQPMVTHVVDAVIASGVDPIVVVTGHEAERITAALEGRDVLFVHNPDFAEGMSSSLRCGLLALPERIDGAVICLGDMPRLQSQLIVQLVERFNPLEGRAIGVPTHKGKRGNPVLWAARYFPEMMQLAGDVGARHLIGEHGEAVYEVESVDESITLDVDTPEALRALAGERA